MKKKLLSILYAFMASVLFTTSALAGGSVKLSIITFGLGSLTADGTLVGLGRTDVTVVLDASGTPVITCINNGSNAVPAQSYPRLTSSGQQTLPGNDPLRKNGKAAFGVETNDPEYLAGDIAGCPNSNWLGRIDFVFWTNATVSVYDTATNAPLLRQDYACTTTRYPASVSCTAIP